MSQFKVTSSVLNSQASELSDLNGRFKSAVEQLVTAEANLNSMWDGEANDAFHASFMTDKSKMDEFYNLQKKFRNSKRLKPHPRKESAAGFRSCSNIRLFASLLSDR